MQSISPAQSSAFTFLYGLPLFEDLVPACGQPQCSTHGRPTSLWCHGFVMVMHLVVSKLHGEALVLFLRYKSGPYVLRHRVMCKCGHWQVVSTPRSANFSSITWKYQCYGYWTRTPEKFIFTLTGKHTNIERQDICALQCILLSTVITDNININTVV